MMRKVSLYRWLMVLCAAMPISAALAIPRPGDVGVRPAIRPVLTPLPERDVLHPIGLNCPMDHANGVMETLWENRAGQRQSTRVSYRAGQMQRLEILRGSVHQPLRSSFIIDLDLPGNDEAPWTVTSLANAADWVRRQVCLGDAAARTQYQAHMDANRAMLRAPR